MWDDPQLANLVGATQEAKKTERREARRREKEAEANMARSERRALREERRAERERAKTERNALGTFTGGVLLGDALESFDERRVLPHTGSHTTAFAWCTPILKDFSRRISPPTTRVQSPPSTPFNSASDAIELHPDVASYGKLPSSAWTLVAAARTAAGAEVSTRVPRAGAAAGGVRR